MWAKSKKAVVGFVKIATLATAMLAAILLGALIFKGAGWIVKQPAATEPAATAAAKDAGDDDWLEIKISHSGKLTSVVRSEGRMDNPSAFGHAQLAAVIDRLTKALSPDSAPPVISPPANTEGNCYDGQHGDSDMMPVLPLTPWPKRLSDISELPKIYEGTPVPPPAAALPPSSGPIILEGQTGRSPARVYPLRRLPQLPSVPSVRRVNDGPRYPYPGIRW